MLNVVQEQLSARHDKQVKGFYRIRCATIVQKNQKQKKQKNLGPSIKNKNKPKQNKTNKKTNKQTHKQTKSHTHINNQTDNCMG